MDDNRQGLEKELYRLYALSRIKNMTQKNREDIMHKIDKIEDMLEDDYEEVLDQDEMDVRREVLKDNSGLNDIFSAIWFCCSEHISGGVLRVQGFVKFYLVVCKALGSFYDGEDGDSRLVEKALSEYVRNVKLYSSEMSRGVFNDIFFKIIELHTEFVDPMYYSAFAWSLLDSVTDLSRQPPAFRPLRTVKTFMTGDNEATMLQNYLNADAQKQATTLKVANEWMDRVPDVMQRIGSRRQGKELTETDIQLVAILANKLRKERLKEKQEGKGGESDEYSDTDSEDGEGGSGSDAEGGGKGKRSNLEKIYDSVFNGKNNFDINAFKDRRRELRKMGVGRSDWLDFQKDPNMPINELAGTDDGMDKLKKSKFGTWVAGSTLKKKSQEDKYGGMGQDTGDRYQEARGREKPKGKTFSAGGKATHTWDDKMVYLQHKNKLKKRIKITKTRALTPQTPASPMKKGPEAPDDVLGKPLDAGVQSMYGEEGSSSVPEPVEEEKGEFDTEEWANFRMSLKKMKEGDEETKRRVEEERVRIEAEIERRKEDMRREMAAYQAARQAESQATKDKAADEEREEQAYLDSLLADVDHSAEIASHPADSIKKIQHPHPDPGEDYLEGPVEFKLEEPTPMLLAKHAVDDASEFNPTYDEQYELDSFFSASGPASVDTGLSSEELAAAILGAAQTASEKKQRREDKMMRDVLADEARGGKWRFGSSKVRHLREEDGASHVSGMSGSASVTISVPQARATPLLPAQATMTEEPALTLTLPEPASLHRVDSMNDLSVASNLSEYGSVSRNYADVFPLGEEVDPHLGTGSASPGAAASLHNLSLSREASFDDGAGSGKGTGVPSGRPGSIGSMMGDAAARMGRQGDHLGASTLLKGGKMRGSLPFPHKAYSTLVEGKKLDGAGGEGKLGSWNHERAAVMQLRTRNPLPDERVLLEADMQSHSSKSLEALRIQRKELPWFRSDLPPRVRGLAYNPNDASKAPAPQRPVVRPEYRRELMGSSGNLLLLAKQGNAPAAGTRGGTSGADAGPPYEGIDVSVPQTSIVSVDSAVASVSEMAGASQSLVGSLDSASDAEGREVARSVGAQAELNLHSSPTAVTATATATAGEGGGGLAGKQQPQQPPPAAHGKGAVLTSNEDSVGDNSSWGPGIGVVPAPVQHNDPSGFVALNTGHGTRLMTGVEPPTTAEADLSVALSATDGPSPGVRAATPGLRILQGSPSVEPIEPLFAESGSLDLGVETLGQQVHNHLVKSIISGSALLQQNNPALSPETKNPAKPRNLVDGPDQDVARGFLQEPDPLPSPNRSKPLAAPQGQALMVRTASLSSRDWLQGPPGIVASPPGIEDLEANRVASPHASSERDPNTATATQKPVEVFEAEVGGADGLIMDKDEGEKGGGEDDASVGGGSVGASVVSFLTADEAPAEITGTVAASSSLSLVHGQSMTDSLVDKSKSLSQVMLEGEVSAVEQARSKEYKGSDAAPSLPTEVHMPPVSSLVIKAYRTVPAIVTEDSAIVPSAAKAAAKDEIEARKVVQRAIMKDTLGSEAKAAITAQSDALAAGSLAGLVPSGSLQGSVSSNAYVVATVERHLDALAPPCYDPVGPAAAMGLATIEHHPRFKYTGLPGPKQQPVSRSMSQTVSSRAPDRVVDVKQSRLERWASASVKASGRPITPVVDDDDEGFIHPDRVEQNLKSTGLELRDSRELARTMTEQPPPFWLPQDLKKADSAIAHDCSNHIHGWQNVKMLLESGQTEVSHANDRASILMTIKRQEAFLERFKEYSMLANLRDSNPDWMRFKHRNEELLPVGKKTQLASFHEKFAGKKLKPKIGKFVPLRKIKKPAAE